MVRRSLGHRLLAASASAAFLFQTVLVTPPEARAESETNRPESDRTASQASGIVSSDATATEAAGPIEGPRIELIDRRTADSRTFLNPDGTYTTDQFAAPIFYIGRNGTYEPIQPTAVASNIPGVAFQTRAGPIQTQFGQRADGELVRVREGAHSVAFRSAVLAGVAPRPIAAREPEADEDGHVFYRDVFPNVDLRYSLLPTGVKEDIILRAPVETPAFVFEIDSETLTPTLEADGSITLASRYRPVFTLPAPFMVDSAPEADGDGVRSTAVRYRLVEIPGRTLLVVEADAAWLADPARVYPIYIDPTTSIYSASADTFISSAYPTTSRNALWNPGEGGYYELWNGQFDATTGTNYAFIKTGHVTSRSIISATFNVYVQHAHSGAIPTAIQLGRLTSGFNESQTWSQTHPSFVALTSDTVVDGEFARFDVTSTAQAWADGDLTNYGFRLYQSSTSASLWKRLRARENSVSTPYLSINYTTPQATLSNPTASEWHRTGVFSWSYSPNGTTFGQQAFSVQVSRSSTSWTSTDLVASSGSVYTSASSWTAPTTNFVAGTTYYWRMSVYDGHSWSGWGAHTGFRYDPQPASLVSSSVGDAVSVAGTTYYDVGNGTFTVKIRGRDDLSGIKFTYLRLYNATDEMRVQHDWGATTTHCNEFDTSTLVDATACSETYESNGEREVTFTVVGLNSDTKFDVQYYLTDYAGNTVGYVDTGLDLVFDATAPAGSITNPAAGATVGGSVNITGTASDTNFKEYTLDYGAGSAPTTWLSIGTNPRSTAVTDGTLGTWDVSSLASGTYTLRLRVFDYARPASGFTTVTRSVTVDNNVPEARITTPANGAFVTGSVSITGTANASFGFTDYTLHYGAGCSPTTWTDIGTNPRLIPVTDGALGTWTTGTLNGSYAIRLVVKKVGGLTNTTVVCVTVDNTTPLAIIGSPVPDEYVNGSVEIIGRASDTNFTSYELHYGSGSAPTTWTSIGTNPRTTAVTDGVLGAWDTSGRPPGVYSIRLRVFDRAHLTTGFGETTRTVTVTDAVNLLAPAMLHADGADLRWSMYDGTAPFHGYEIHRSQAATFTPSASTLLVTIGDKGRTTFRDTSARPGGAFTYSIVVCTTAACSNAADRRESARRTVTLPAAGQATLTLQPGPSEGSVTHISSAVSNCTNFGVARTFNVGTRNGVRRGLFSFDLRQIPADATITSATFSYFYEPTSVQVGPVNLHRATAAWEEGSANSSCDGSGATWSDAAGGAVAWTSAGGDYIPTAIASASPTSRSAGGWDDFAIAELVQDWIDGSAPNHGLLVRLATEPSGSTTNYFTVRSDDYGLDPTTRPKLTVTFSEPVDADAPLVNVGGATPSSTVAGTVNLTAGATDDGGVASVEFLVDGVAVGTDLTPPYAAAWNTASASNAGHVITARAIDRAGNATTSAGLDVNVDNSGAPTVSITAPTGGSVSGSSVSVTANAADDLAVTRVEFFMDDYIIGSDTAAPFAVSWNTLDPNLVAFDGTHVITARATDSGGRVTTSAPVNLTVANRTGQFFGAIETSSIIPRVVFEDDQAAGRTQKTHPANPQHRRTLASNPVNSEPNTSDTTPGKCDDSGPKNTSSATGYSVSVSVQNTSATNWSNNRLELWYRWYNESGEVVFEGPAPGGRLPGLAAGATISQPRTFTVFPPALCGEEQLAEYQLRIDIFDTQSDTWFAAHGNQPFERSVTVGRRLNGPNAESDTLGLERFYQYWGTDVGAGMSHLVNVANGNSLLQWTPLQAPGIGLSTVLNLTYNSLENHSRSPVGNNWSLSISSLSRFGFPLDIHANGEGSAAQRWVLFTDGDGTTHRFEGRESNGTVYWEEPPGVHLWLREYDTTSTQTQAAHWALSRPDGVTFLYNSLGYPVAVSDRNGNTLAFELEAVPSGEDPGGPQWRVKKVTDQGGRSFTITYYGKDDAKRPQIRGNIRRITDHTESAIEFDYYYDGNLMRIRQVGGTSPDGSVLADRTFLFTYTTPSGDGAAISDPSLRVEPDPKTNQSTRLYSVRDPRGHETRFTYNGPTTNLDRWKISGVTDRAGATTAFTYDRPNNITTVTAPASRVTSYLYDATGKVTQITDPLGRLTTITWNADYHVSRLDEPGDPLQEFAYNDNGYLTSIKACSTSCTPASAVVSHTTLTYENLTADRAGSVSDPASGSGTRDAAPLWRAGRTIPHISQLDTKTDPNGNDNDTTTSGSYRWLFDYDGRGNLTTLTDPMSFASTFAYNPNGTVDTATDANGNVTKYADYDPSGLPEVVLEGYNVTTGAWLSATRFAYDADGLLTGVQDPNHFPLASPPLDPTTLPAMSRTDSAVFEYDAFHRLVRQSSPKSTSLERGMLIWTAASYDPNDNVTRQIGAQFGTGFSGSGPQTDVAYDAMDRQTLITGPDREDDTAGERTAFAYDAAGRLISVTEPLGYPTPAADDFTSRFTYDLLDRVIRQTRYLIDGTTTTQHYTHACYNAAGDLVSVTAPRYGQATVTCSDPNLTFTTRFEYDDAHRRTAVIDPEGRRSETSYDANGNAIAARDALMNETRVVFDQRNLPTRVEEPFDRGADRPDFVTTAFEYDAVGNRTRLVTPRAFDVAGGTAPFDLYSTSYQYDALNRVSRVSLPTSGAANDPQLYVHRLYDKNGNPTLVSLPSDSSTAPAPDDGVSTVTRYWDTGWVESILTPDTTPETHFEYAAQGWQTLRVPELPTGEFNVEEELIWTYEVDGMLASRRDIRSDATTYDYDANNRLIEAVDSTGVTAHDRSPLELIASYDTLNRLTRTQQRETNNTATYMFTSFRYDANGNVFERVDNGKDPIAGGLPTDPGRTQSYTYDDADWMLTQIDQGDPDIADDSTRVTNDFWPTGREHTRTVARGNHTTGTWTESQTTSWTWFANGKLDQLAIQNGANQVLERHEVEYETQTGVYMNGHRIEDAFWRDAPEVPGVEPAPCQVSPGCTATYAYDARDRLFSENDGHGTATSYLLDPAGNILRATEITGGTTTETAYEYLGNQLQSVTSPAGDQQRYWYDPRGNLECVTIATGTATDCALASGGSVSNEVLARYSYDELDRLVGLHSYAIDEAGTHAADDSAQYEYDALDRVLEQTESHDGAATDPRTTLLTYLGLSNQLTEEEHRNAAGLELTTKSYSYDAWGHRLAVTNDVTDAGSPGSGDPAAETYTYGHDVHGSVSLLINQAGTASASYGYRPYGGADDALTVGDFDPSDPDETEDPATGLDPRADNPLNPFRYSARRYDSGSGTVDMGARRFGPDTGRFLQRDHLSSALADLGLSVDPISGNRYSLAGGNPVSFVEWDGHVTVPDGGGNSSPEPTPLRELAETIVGVVQDVTEGALVAADAAKDLGVRQAQSVVDGAGAVTDLVVGQAEAAAQGANALCLTGAYSAEYCREWSISPATISRANFNSLYSVVGLGLSHVNGGECEMQPGLILECYEGSPFGRTITFGNVILTNEGRTEYTSFENRFVRQHEYVHVDQEAMLPLGLFPVLYYTNQFAAIQAEHHLSSLTGTHFDPECLNVFEAWAGLEEGGYSCP